MIITLIYSILLTIAVIVWHSAKPLNFTKGNKKISIICVVRNEEKNILKLLKSFQEQTYTNFEIIIVDDSSTDRTVKLIEESNLSNLRILHLNSLERGNSPKKKGIEKAIKFATGEYIFSTDGDCILPPKILEIYSNILAQNANIHMLCGPVTFRKENSTWNKLQIVEFASLIGSAAVSMFLKRPIMSSAANFIYRKETFVAINGFENSYHIASGDDEYLMNKIAQKHTNSVEFVKNSNCIVHTNSSENLITFYHQRKRWAGKWNQSINISSQLTAVFIFLVNAFTIYHGITQQWDLILLRCIPELLFLGSVLHFLNQKHTLIFIPLTQLIYPIYVVFFGIISVFPSKYNWKERKLK